MPVAHHILLNSGLIIYNFGPYAFRPRLSGCYNILLVVTNLIWIPAFITTVNWCLTLMQVLIVGADGKKGVVHVATPHPSKQAGKTAKNEKSKQQSPKSAGGFKCNSCDRYIWENCNFLQLLNFGRGSSCWNYNILYFLNFTYIKCISFLLFFCHG